MKSHWGVNLSRAALLLLLLVLCLRMTINEGMDDGFIGTLTTQLTGLSIPVEIAGLSALIFLCTGVTLLVQTPWRWWQWASLAAILILTAIAMADAFIAPNHFAALIGACDFSMNLLAGWSLAMLCTTINRRALVLCVLMALAACLTFKGLYQHYVEIPQTIADFSHHPGRWLNRIGLKPGSPAIRLFLSRLKSREVSGFGSDNDQFGEGLIPLILLALGLAAVWKIGKKPDAAPIEGRRRVAVAASDTDRATLMIGSIFCGMVGAAALVVLLFTRSKGSIAATIICIAAALIAVLNADRIARYRYRIFVGGVTAAGVGAAAIITMGLLLHRLPTRDLLFRWQYWNGAAAIVAHHPLAGVGLNNFGYYYTQYKWPSAPEDVKDPHSVFVRVAAELGLPALLIYIFLVGLAFYLIFRSPTASLPRPKTPPMAVLIGFAVVWWIGVALLASIGESQARLYLLELAGLYAAMTVTTMAIVSQLLTLFNDSMFRKVEIALAVGAGGMLLYDQINLALVTGGVAMLFWVVLAIARPADAPSAVGEAAKWSARTAKLAGGCLIGGGLILALGLCVPAAAGRFSWDVRPYQARYRSEMATGHLHHALADCNHILAIDRRSQNWQLRKIKLLEALGRSPRSVVLRVLSENRADARIRIPLAMSPNSGLTLREQIAQLKLALKLNSDLPKTEVTRLSPRHVAAVKEMISIMDGQLRRRHPQTPGAPNARRAP